MNDRTWNGGANRPPDMGAADQRPRGRSYNSPPIAKGQEPRRRNDAAGAAGERRPEEPRGYRDLIAWQKAIELALQVHQLAKKLPAEERPALSDPLRRSAVSAAAHIAEGQAQKNPAEFAQYLVIARGRLAELDTLLQLALRLGYVTETDLQNPLALMVAVRQLTQRLMQSLDAQSSGAPANERVRTT